MKSVIARIHESLAAISAPRFFESERGFQGELLIQLSNRLQLSDKSIIEQEYQKRRQAHGLRIRPDIIIHEPFDPKIHEDRTEGNFAVIELKLNASAEAATEDFKSLEAMLVILQYPIGFFINIGSPQTYSHLVSERVRGKIVCFSVYLEKGKAIVTEVRP